MSKSVPPGPERVAHPAEHVAPLGDVVEHLGGDDRVELGVVVELARVELARLDSGHRRRRQPRVDADDLRPLAHRGPQREVAAADVEHASRPPLDEVEQQPDLRSVARKRVPD